MAAASSRIGSSHDPSQLLMSLFGVDVGTTAVKCAVVRASVDHELLAASYVALDDVPNVSAAGAAAQVAVQGEQSVEQVLLAVHRAIAALPREHREQISSIGICGQMHGIMWWCSSSVPAQVQGLFVSSEQESEAPDTAQQQQEQPAWSKLVTWQDQRCSSAFLEQCNNDIRQNASENGASSTSPLATGYGLATFAHTLANAPKSLESFDACGTIQDFIAFVLCGHHSPANATIDTTNAFSWGGFDLQSATWNKQTIAALKIPFEMLPVVKKPGEIIGHVDAETLFGLPNGIPVYVPIGDHPSSVIAALVQRQQPNYRSQLETNLTLVNFGTSAQLAMLLSADEVAEIQNASKSFEIRPFLFENQFVGVAASLSGGNIYAWLVKQCQDWIQELQTTSTNPQQRQHDDGHSYKRLIDLGMAKVDTELIFTPTLNGERADPSMRGSIQQLCMTNWSLGDISAALCKGLINNLFGMVPGELQASVSTRKMIGTGSALVRNDLLRHFLAARLSDPPNQLQIQHAADAAIGAALTPVLLQ